MRTDDFTFERGIRLFGTLVLLASSGVSEPARADESADRFAADVVDSVTVFPDRAEVTRLRKGPCLAGKGVVTFERLPESLDPLTLRGGVRGGGETIGVQTDMVDTTEAMDEKVRALDDRLREIEGKIRAEQMRKSSLAEALKDLEAYGNILIATVNEEMRNPRPELARLERNLEALRKKREALGGQVQNADRALRSLGRTADQLKRQREHHGDGDTLRHRRATVTVDCGQRSETTATVSYVVPGATWNPEYDVDFTTNGGGKTGPGKVRITVGVVVRQATGEDWRDAKVQLSTAKPKLGSEAPYPLPVWVDARERGTERTVVQGVERRENLQTGGKAASGGAQGATVDDKGNTFVLTLPHRLTIPADGRPTWAPVDVLHTSGTGKLVTIPRLDDRIYRIVSFKNPAAYPLVDGRAHGYRAGSFVGSTQLGYKGLAEPIELSLGVDDEIQIERTKVDEKTRDARLFSSDRTKVEAYRSTLTSGATNKETVEVRENVPVSKVDSIKVTIDQGRTTKGFDFDRVRGFLVWQVVISPAQKETVDLGYSIALPEDWTVN